MKVRCNRSPTSCGAGRSQSGRDNTQEEKLAQAFKSQNVLLSEVARLKVAAVPSSLAEGVRDRMRYRADITAGSLKLPESRIVAGLLLNGVDERQLQYKILDENLLQARNAASAKRLGRLIRNRLTLMQPELWRMIRDGSMIQATHATLAAAVKHSPLLGDFLDLVVRDQYRLFNPVISNKFWDDYLSDCRGRDSEMPEWNESTRKRLRSSVFQILAQAGYIENTRTLKLQSVHISPQVLQYLGDHDERYVLRCIQVGP